VDARKIFQVARETIERFNNHYVKGSLSRLVKHPQQAVAAQNRATGAGSIFVRADNS
jgi:hypothetical protein